MPAQHKPGFISNAEWSQFGERVRCRQRGGPSNLALSALIVQALLLRFKRASRREDILLIYLIEQVALWEDRIVVSGCDLLDELKHAHSIFDPLLRAIACPAPHEKIPKHDALIIRIQYDLLWTWHRDHPFPRESMRKQRAWLTTQWKHLEQLLQQAPCHCVYRSPDAEPPTPSFPTTPKKLFLDLLAHIHRSTPDSIGQFLKPGRRR